MLSGTSVIILCSDRKMTPRARISILVYYNYGWGEASKQSWGEIQRDLFVWKDPEC